MMNKKDAPKGAVVDGSGPLDKRASRRGLLKGVVVSVVALAATAGAAKKAGDYLLKEEPGKSGEAEELQAERALKGKKLVLMSEAEKDELIRSYHPGGKQTP